MTGEEKFQVDLEGYLVIKDILTDDEVAEMNAIIDKGDRQGAPSLWGEPFKRLIDHPKILPYLIELLGPHVRLDHDYSLFMEKGQGRGGLHGGEDGGRAGGSVGDHWYKYRDGHMRNGSIRDDLQSDGRPSGCRRVRLYSREAIRAILHPRSRKKFADSSVRHTTSSNPQSKPEMSSFSRKHSSTERCRGQPIMSGEHCSINTVPDTRHGRATITTSANTGN